MSLSSKIGRIADLFQLSRARGLPGAIRTTANRYRYDHAVSRALPVVNPVRPYHLQIEPSRVCNLRCKMCEYSYMENKGHVMSLETFRRILAQFPELTSVDITGIGEPFCNPHFLEIVRYAKSRGLFVGFVNNGNLLTPERMDALIDMRVDQIMFSVDAATRETHEAIRVYSRFDRVLDTIRTLSDKVIASGRTIPERHMNFTMSSANIDEAPDFVGLAHRLGVSHVAFRAMVFFEGSAYGQEDGIDRLSPERLREIRDRVLSEGEKYGVDVDLDPLLAGTADQHRLCMRPWMNAYVDVFGNLYPCCLVTQRNIDIRQFSLGNLLTDRVDDIWNNEFYQELRRAMAHPTEIPPLCDGCVMLRKNSTDAVPQLVSLS
ncbi:MAG: radical SAM protein [Planctomycetaceae bacterium]|nr:radical SAM protein [Planctomycetaceae bacterium]